MTDKKRKIIGRLWLILTAVLFTAVLTTCGAETGNGIKRGADEMESFEGLDAQMVRRIKQDFMDDYNNSKPAHIDAMTLNDIWFSKYYGTYNGCVVIDIDSASWQYSFFPWEVEIAGIRLYRSYYKKPYVWKDGIIHDNLQKAYDEGFLEVDDLKCIAGQLKSLPGYSDDRCYF